MAENTKKARKHSFLDKHVIAGSILLMMWVMGAAQSVFGSLAKVIPGMPEDLCIALGALVLLGIHTLWFRPDYEGSLRGGKPALGFRLAATMSVYYIYLLVQTFTVGQFRVPTLTAVWTSVMAGVVEETAFRALPVSLMMRKWRDASKIPTVLIVSSVCFGMIHAMNVFGGAPVGITIIQVIGAGCMGVLFTAVYLRCGNILPVMIMHGLTDFLCFMDASQATEDGLMIAEVGFINYLDVFFCAILVVIAVYLVRPAKRGEILALWDKKWNRA